MRLSYVCKLDNGNKINNVELPLLDAKYLRKKADKTIITSGIFVDYMDYLILVDGENSGEVFRAPEQGIMGSTFKKLYICNSLHDVYVLYILKFYQNMFRNSKKGAAIPHLDKQLFSSLLIGLPPLAEQKRIVKKIEELEPFVEEYGKAETELTALNNNFPEQIKKSILQYAIQGKLVEQDPNDEPASELLKKIKAEKAELVKQGKIKKDKQESYIFKGDDNRHYEQIGSETKDITEEILFEIPNNWEWVRFANVSLYSTDYVANGSFASLRENVKIYKEKNFALLVKTQDFSNNFSRDLTYIDERSYNFLEKSKLYGGELMMSNIGASIGKVFIIPNLNMPMSIAPNSIIIKFSDENITQFVNYLISSPFGQDILKVFTAGTAMPKFSKTQLRGCLIPIPPYGEQIRIINKIKKLFDLIESL